MRQEAANGDVLGATEAIADRGELRNVSDDGIVEREPAGIAQLHDRQPRERLGDRGDAEQRLLIDRPR